ncbi:Cox family DNA-binding protein [Arsenophonus sp. PmNCSU2021_1]|uniref:Cox family DNA-binding protein n=1 Tax=Arsenophonus sp. PmNCSU2021_1 TaxID=3118989 RepID=UPI002FEF148B
MINDDYEMRYPIDVMHVKKFAELIGKTPSAVQEMIENNKLPVIPLQDPSKPNSRVRERLIYIPEFNRGLRAAYFNRPAEERDAWLKWLGL